MALFRKSSTYLDREAEDWLLETFAWLMRERGGVRKMKWAPLVTPERKFFPPTEAKGHDRAEHVLRIVSHLMGVGQGACELRPPETLWRTPEGDGPTLIEYSDVGAPMTLVSELAHGVVAHLLWRPGSPPGGEDMFWPTCSVGVAYTGFGVFGANAARQDWTISGKSSGSSETGHLPESAWALALAIYEVLTEREGESYRWLDGTMKGLATEALHYVRKRPELLTGLRAID